VTEFDAGWLATMFTADSELDVRARLASEVASNFHQSPDTLLIDRREGICLNDIQFGVRREKTPRIVAAHSQCRLCEIVCAKAEELSMARDLISDERSTWYFDHRPHQILEFCSSFFRNLVSDSAHNVDLEL
jgi:hypothetical protein